MLSHIQSINYRFLSRFFSIFLQFSYNAVPQDVTQTIHFRRQPGIMVRCIPHLLERYTLDVANVDALDPSKDMWNRLTKKTFRIAFKCHGISEILTSSRRNQRDTSEKDEIEPTRIQSLMNLIEDLIVIDKIKNNVKSLTKSLKKMLKHIKHCWT